MTSFELDPRLSSLRYQPAHCLIPIQSGARCRVCAVLYNGTSKHFGAGGSFCGGGSCTGYKPNDHSFFLFVSACCKLQDVFKQICKQWPPVQPWKPLLGMTASELWWWEVMNLSQQQCQNSLVVLAAHWENMLRQSWCSSKSQLG
mgnify:CR=1 FL=1